MVASQGDVLPIPPQVLVRVKDLLARLICSLDSPRTHNPSEQYDKLVFVAAFCGNFLFRGNFSWQLHRTVELIQDSGTRDTL